MDSLALQGRVKVLYEFADKISNYLEHDQDNDAKFNGYSESKISDAYVFSG